MHQFSGILLHVDFMDADDLFLIPHLDFHPAVLADGKIQLADLVGFGQIGIKVVFAVEFCGAGDGAVGGQSRPDGDVYKRQASDRLFSQISLMADMGVLISCTHCSM